MIYTEKEFDEKCRDFKKFLDNLGWQDRDEALRKIGAMRGE